MYVIAVTGGSGSGKSFLCQKLIEKLGSNAVCHLSQDHYYLPRNLQPYDHNGIQNFDTLQSINVEDFYKDVLSLMSGQEISKEEYVYNNPKVEASQLIFKPRLILLLEGLLLLHHASISQLANLKIFVEAPEDLKLKRRIQRDAVERGYDNADVNYRFIHHVTPMYDKLIAPYKSLADIVVINDKSEIDSVINEIVQLVGKSTSK